jgi:hypothetical protein
MAHYFLLFVESKKEEVQKFARDARYIAPE